MSTTKKHPPKPPSKPKRPPPPPPKKRQPTPKLRDDGPTAARMRQATQPEPPKETKAMTTDTANHQTMGTGRATGQPDPPKPLQQRPRDTSPRGAGSGEAAIRARSRIEPSTPLIAHEDHVEQLIAQAEANEAENNEANRKQVEAANKFQTVMDEFDAERANPPKTDPVEIPDPRDPAVMKAQAAFRAKVQGTATDPAEDHAPGNNRTVQGTPAADAGAAPARH